jgi:hypothetical protein
MLESLTDYKDNDKVINAYKNMYKKTVPKVDVNKAADEAKKIEDAKKAAELLKKVEDAKKAAAEAKK